MIQAVASCFWLLMQAAACPLSLAADKAGSNSAARMAMIAITTSNSIKVNARNETFRHDLAVIFLNLALLIITELFFKTCFIKSHRLFHLATRGGSMSRSQ